MTTRNDAPRLLDVMTRHQAFLERLKEYQFQQYNAVADQLRRDIRLIFSEIEYGEMSSFTKRELDLFVKRLKRAQILRFNTYTQQVLLDLERYMAADTRLNVRIMEATQREADAEDPLYDEKKAAGLLALLAPAKTASLWASVLAAPLQANGVYPQKFLDSLTGRGALDIENLMRKARANRMTVKQALTLLVGSERLNFKDGLLERLRPQSEAVAATLWQHASGIAQAAAASVFFKFYRWVSVLDSKTSAICRSRDGRVYRYGEGPLPPAHPRCRSTTEPVEPDGNEAVDETYAAWLKRQPQSVKDELAKQSPLTLEAFLSKLNTMLD